MEAPGRVFRLQEEGNRSPVIGSSDQSTTAGTNDGRQPLKSLQTPTTMSSSTALGSMEGGRTKQSPAGATHWYHHWANSLPQFHDDVKPTDLNPGSTVASFELEDTTASSGGTSWTLRVPWLRNKRHKNKQLRMDDENSSIQTIPSSSIRNKPGAYGTTEDNNNSPYYGGLMKAASPTFVSVDSGNIEALESVEGDGLYRTTPPSSTTQPSRVLHEQRQPQRQQQPKQPFKQKRKQPNKRNMQQRQPFASNMDQNLLLPQQNTTSPPPAAPVTAPTGTTTGTSENRQYVLLQQKPEPKNHNKVFRNRSWISTSSRESNSRGRPDEDSLADFDEGEWTPQDSSYGAAIPVCGWVPKRLRQFIEATLISFAVFVLVYIVVTTSISISEAKDAGREVYNDTSSGSKVYDNGLEFDDDWYVEYSQYPNEDDDYFYDGDNNGNGGG
ncbi:expressed unknown protein [Seminavis robusta]|uniref:Uncharacterized protein n=1 Tax=Seminavis robusta TaxID=568900 RepID=A0A9N8HPZ3_9STRA|nr:expressed unknown protein [Seminavis robusta]|eukprot:Sro1142_g245830.1 n/a (441) ;mRNA; f:24362-25773